MSLCCVETVDYSCVSLLCLWRRWTSSVYLCCVCGDGGLVLCVSAVFVETVDFLHHLDSPVYL